MYLAALQLRVQSTVFGLCNCIYVPLFLTSWGDLCWTLLGFFPASRFTPFPRTHFVLWNTIGRSCELHFLSSSSFPPASLRRQILYFCGAWKVAVGAYLFQGCSLGNSWVDFLRSCGLEAAHLGFAGWWFQRAAAATRGSPAGSGLFSESHFYFPAASEEGIFILWSFGLNDQFFTT